MARNQWTAYSGIRIGRNVLVGGGVSVGVAATDGVRVGTVWLREPAYVADHAAPGARQISNASVYRILLGLNRIILTTSDWG